MATSSTGKTQIQNFKLLANHQLDGFGGMGEGMSIQIAPDGRRIIWLAHESAPKNFTGVDVTDPKNPKVVVQTNLPTSHMRSNSLEISGNIMAVAYQTQKVGQQPAGMELFDISKPENPKSIAFFDRSGPHSRGVHVLWFCDGEYVHMAAGAPDFEAGHELDDQCYQIIDVRNPSKPTEVGRWWLPGTKKGETPIERHKAPALDKGFRAHNTNVYPSHPDRCYLAYLDGGMIIMDISDKSKPKMISRWDNSPPYTGFTHTMIPLFKRGLAVMTDELTVDGATDWPKLMWIVDIRDEKNPVPIATCPPPDFDMHAHKGGRFGAHNMHENLELPTSFHSEEIVFGTYFGGGLMAYDISNPYRPEVAGMFIPPAPNGSKVGAIQLNDVFVDERRIVYTVDRFTGGLYILEPTF